jgi:TetR/AcrR family transcriptional regulator, regulator of autoinduction and epiphytic fitness
MTTTDGRVTRGRRNREAIVDALLECYEAGSLRPSVPEVAARAGVAVRSVHNHFTDVEALHAELARRQVERYAPSIGPAASVEEFVDQRAAVYEAITPVRRAALIGIHDSPTIAESLSRAESGLRRHAATTFPGLSPEALDAIDMVSSWDAWDRLRSRQGCSFERARRVVIELIRNTVERNVECAGFDSTST